jgi:hypothetical protein
LVRCFFLLAVIIDGSYAQSSEADSQFHLNNQTLETTQNETEEGEMQLNTDY